MPKVKFVVEHHVVEALAGLPLREIALAGGVYPNRELLRGVNCGGRGICGTCRVWVAETSPGSVSPPTLREKIHGVHGSRRLACQTRVHGDIEVTTMPGGDDRTEAGRVIDPVPVRPEVRAEMEKKPAEGAEGAEEAKPVLKKEPKAAEPTVAAGVKEP